MDAERWRQIEQLYYVAVKLDPDQWDTFLAQACQGSDELRTDVRSLLEQNDSTTALRGGQLWALANDLLTHLCPSALTPGQRLGPYRVEGPLGAGGMGEVYRGRDTRLDRSVAIKVLRGHGPSDEKCRERFQREAHAASALNHPNICAVYDIGECEGRPYLVMEYLEGHTLRERLRQGLLGLQEMLVLAIQITDALDAAHSRGILHRDIKAANIFVTDRHQAKVLDFGIAKVIGYAAEVPKDSATATLTHLTEPGNMVGTVAYMSPEQARGEQLDARSDLFSFGVLLYEMGTGQLPFKGNTPAIIFDAILNRKPLPARKLRSELPCELETIIISALEKDRELRVRTAAELRTALKDLMHKVEFGLLSPKALHAEKVPGLASGVWQKRRALGLAMLTLLFVLFIGMLFVLRRRFSPPVRSLVVLPLENLPPEASQRYLVEGMTDGLILELSKIGSLQVIKGARKPFKQLAQELHAQRIVDGSVTRSGEQVRLSVKIVGVPDNRTLWAGNYQGGLGDVPALQSAAAREIAAAMNVRLTPQEMAELAKSRTVSSKAYEAYLRGRQLWNRQTAKDLREAAEEFRDSIDAAPNYAPAYAGLADCYSMLGWFGAVRPLDVLDAARAAAKKAQQLDPTLAEAYISEGIVSGFFDWDWLAADKDFKTAISLNPSLADGHHWYAHMLEAVGRPDEALSELNRAHELDALYPLIDEDVALAYLYRRDYDRAMVQTQKLLELQPRFWRVHTLLGKIYRDKRMFPEATSELERAITLSGGNVSTSATLGQVYALSGSTNNARRVLQDLIDRSKGSYIDPESIAEIYVALGQKDEGLLWLEKACSNRVPRFSWLAGREPIFDSLRSDARFKNILKRMRLSF